MTKQSSEIVLGKIVEKRIFLIRGHRVMLDSDLADLYDVQTRYLNRVVKRNPDRFPVEFMFQLTYQEFTALMCQFGTSNRAGRGGRRKLPFVFTEHGIAMLSSVLNSNQAIQVNIVIIKTFVKTRQYLSDHASLLKRIEEIEKNVTDHSAQLKEVFKTLREVIGVPVTPKHPLGIRSPKD